MCHVFTTIAIAIMGNTKDLTYQKLKFLDRLVSYFNREKPHLKKQGIEGSQVISFRLDWINQTKRSDF